MSLRADTTVFTADTTDLTADATRYELTDRPAAGAVRLIRGNSSYQTLSPATARPGPVAADRELFRPPYSDSWYVDGPPHRGPETLELTLEIHDDTTGIAGAAVAAATALADLAAATLIDTPWGVFVNRGLTEITRTPIEAGYRLQARLATDGWTPDGQNVLRLIDGRIWELR